MDLYQFQCMDLYQYQISISMEIWEIIMGLDFKVLGQIEWPIILIWMKHINLNQIPQVIILRNNKSMIQYREKNNCRLMMHYFYSFPHISFHRVLKICLYSIHELWQPLFGFSRFGVLVERAANKMALFPYPSARIRKTYHQIESSNTN